MNTPTPPANESPPKDTLNPFNIGKFIAVKQIGEGSNGRVYKVFKNFNPNQIYALKVSKEGFASLQDCLADHQNELSILRKCRYHPNIIHLHGYG